jgi:putative Mg2+ transporter-C (MgtC) family protein
MAAHLGLLDAIGRLGLALALGAVIGFERQWAQKMAGLRTNALVALGASGFVFFSAVAGGGDPTRIAAQVVSGIGFLGAGIILREGINIHGLNTAATLWCSAMVGTFCGGGFWVFAAGAAALVVATNLVLRPLLRHLNARPVDADGETHYTIEITCRGPEEAHTRSLLLHALSEAGLGLRRLDSVDIPETAKVNVTAQAVALARNDSALERVVGRLSLEPHVSGATWQVDRAFAEN